MNKLSERHYGLPFQRDVADATARCVEDIEIKGFTVIADAVSRENNMYANPLLRQQIDIPAALKREGADYSDDPFLRSFLGYTSRVPASWHDFVVGRMDPEG